jgi:hypothetical protein
MSESVTQYTVTRWAAGERMGTSYHATREDAERHARHERKTWHGPMQSVAVDTIEVVAPDAR